jgi:hypothetical protein
MFVLCPHCQFLVALDPASGQPPQRCPRCDEPLQSAPPSAIASAPVVPVEPEPAAPTVAEAVIASDASTAPATTPAPKTKPRSRPKPAPAIGTSTPDPAPTTVPAAPAVARPEADTVATATEPAPPVATTVEATPAPVADTDYAPVAATPEPPALTPTVATTTDLGVDAGGGDIDPAPAAGGATPAAARETVPEPVDTTPAPSPAPAPRGKATPSFVRIPTAETGTDHRRKWRKPAALAALALLLALQLLLADRAQLAASARWRPLVSTLCGALHCNLPPWREPAAFTLLHRDVRPHPTLPGVLHVSATFRNDARWPQPWPALLLTLSDVDGRSVGARAFAPPDYLGGAPTHAGVASGQSATVVMDIVEPAPRIVAFTFDFH